MALLVLLVVLALPAHLEAMAALVVIRHLAHFLLPLVEGEDVAVLFLPL